MKGASSLEAGTSVRERKDVKIPSKTLSDLFSGRLLQYFYFVVLSDNIFWLGKTVHPKQKASFLKNFYIQSPIELVIQN